MSPSKRRRHPDLRPRRAGDRGRRPAEGSSRRHGSDHAAEDLRAAPRDRISGGEGHASARPTAISVLSKSSSTTMPSGAILARGSVVRCAAQWRDVALRHHARSVGRHAAIPRPRSARRLSARRSRRSRALLRAALKARDLVGTFDKPRYIDFTEDLCAHSRSKHRRLPPLPRPVPDRRDHARGRSCRNRRAYLRGLRAMRGSVPHRRRLLCVAAADLDAQAAHAAHDLSRRGRQPADRAAS